MNSIPSNDDLFASLGLGPMQEQKKDSGELGLENFLQLMITQLNNQDPFEPMDNGQFLGQIAQFGTVSGLNQLNEQFTDLAGSLTSGQALQAGNLVGRKVLAPVNVGQLRVGEMVTGEAELGSTASEVTLRVSNQFGQLVREMSLGSQSPGTVSFAWDGLTDDGTYAHPGNYRFDVLATTYEGTHSLGTNIYADVESVSLGSGGTGLTLNLRGLGPVSFNNVKQIQ